MIIRFSFRRAALCGALVALVTSVALGQSVQPSGQSQPAGAAQASSRFFERADLSRLVVVGDSLSAGFQNGSLLDRQQVNGYATLVALRARKTLPLPLIAEPGVPNVLQLVSPGPPPIILPAPGISTGRTNPLEQPRNLAVPGARVQDALTRRPDFPIDSLTDLVLGLPGLLGGQSRSQVELAEVLRPTTVFLWIGNNDALGAATAADPALLTPQADFEAAYRQVINRLAATGAKLVVANIPDVSVVPFLTSAEDVARTIGLPLAVIGPALGLAAGDSVTPGAFSLIPGILANPASGPLPGNVVLTAAESNTIRAAVRNYNRFIAAQVRRHRAALVDINLVLNLIDRFGYFVAGRRLTTDFLGGLFSLDGVHPTNTGYAIVANQFILALNLRYLAFIPPVNVRRIALADPLVPPFGGGATAVARIGKTSMSVPADVERAVRAVLAPEK
ncbi:MAG: SGNH/GDSL hydrolase family protein [Pyrinomonadaceae bacterium]